MGHSQMLTIINNLLYGFNEVWIPEAGSFMTFILKIGFITSRLVLYVTKP